MNKNPYKIGDWVYCTNPQNTRNKNDDYIMKVIEVDSDGWISGIWSTTGEKNGHSYKHYRYATESEINSVLYKDEFNYEIF